MQEGSPEKLTICFSPLVVEHHVQPRTAGEKQPAPFGAVGRQYGGLTAARDRGRILNTPCLIEHLFKLACLPYLLYSDRTKS